MDENKVIRPMDFVRLTNIDELNVIKDTKNHIGLVKEVSRDGRMSIIWIGETSSQLAWFKSSELEVVDNLVSIHKRIHLAYDHACHYWGLLLILKIIS
jgi:hypothetical protein